MSSKIRWITHTALMLALLICLQWAGSFVPTSLARQLVTGSLVNCVLAVTVLVVGLNSGITVAVISPVLAYLLGIAPQIIVVPAIMLGNTMFVSVLFYICDHKCKNAFRMFTGWVSAAAVKCFVLYALVVQVICGPAAEYLLGKKLGDIVLLAPEILNVLPGMFAWPQLVTALAGGGVALLITPMIRRALNR